MGGVGGADVADALAEERAVAPEAVAATCVVSSAGRAGTTAAITPSGNIECSPIAR